MTRYAFAASICSLWLAVVVRARPHEMSFNHDNPAETLAIVVNQANPVQALTLAELRRIFMLDTQTWPNGRKITVVLREKGQPEREEAIRLVCDMSEVDYDHHILFQTFRGSIGWGPRSIMSAKAMLRFIFNVPGAIGYVPADDVEGTKVLRIDGFPPADPGYPLRRGARGH
jgi:hypothetical protein